MTGPPYPPPAPSDIGEFVIGLSPIGSTPAFDFNRTLISQYANSPAIYSLIESFFDAVDQTENIDSFFDMIMNINTAQGYGLDVWGRIVGVQRTLNVPNVGKYLGFEEAGTISADPWNQSPWFSGDPLTDNFSLADGPFRTLIFAKALSNICDGSIKAINQLLLTLFPGRGNCYVTDGLDMSMTYTFKFALSPVEVAILQQTGVLPTPCGVFATILQVP